MKSNVLASPFLKEAEETSSSQSSQDTQETLKKTLLEDLFLLEVVNNQNQFQF